MYKERSSPECSSTKLPMGRRKYTLVNAAASMNPGRTDRSGMFFEDTTPRIISLRGARCMRSPKAEIRNRETLGPLPLELGGRDQECQRT